jgi:transposase InsO family protein
MRLKLVPFVPDTFFEYIEVFYNRQRRHSTNGYRSPAQAEEQIA